MSIQNRSARTPMKRQDAADAFERYHREHVVPVFVKHDDQIQRLVLTCIILGVLVLGLCVGVAVLALGHHVG